MGDGARVVGVVHGWPEAASSMHMAAEMAPMVNSSPFLQWGQRGADRLSGFVGTRPCKRSWRRRRVPRCAG
jgi:hypothetical protein